MVPHASERARGVSVHWRGHAFLFDRRPAPAYDSATGLRLLTVFVALEGIIGPRLYLYRWLELPDPPIWLRIPVQLALALLLIRLFARLPLASIGFHRWRNWSATERSYLVQVIVIANVLFGTLFAGRLGAVIALSSWPAFLGGVFVPYLVYGFYQEVMYRGILQMELTRRWGVIAGMTAANLLYTFGPLHFYYFLRYPAPLPMFAGVFAIGAAFAVLRWRSGNLWIPAVMHAIGNAYIVGALG